MTYKVYATSETSDWWVEGVGQIGGGLSHESEHDLALMVSDFLENGGSAGADSWCSSDSESGFTDLVHLADKIQFNKHTALQHESNLLSVVHSLILSMNERDLHFIKSAPCNANCIRFSLVKLLGLNGYDAAVCASRWQGGGKVPGGDHEYIEVINYSGTSKDDRLIIDIDFRSHFEIARAVDSYDRILKLLPVIYVGSLTRLKHLLQVMVEAARYSLKLNSMPLPPWRSLAYLQSKWQSSFKRVSSYPTERNVTCISSSDYKRCGAHLKRLQSALQLDVEGEQQQQQQQRLLKPISDDWRLKRERRRLPSLKVH